MARLFLSLLALGVLMIPSCQDPAPDSPKTSKGTIGVSVLTNTNPFFTVIGQSITEEAQQHGYDTVVVSGDNDVARQRAQIKDFITQNVAAIVLCPCDSRSIGSAIREANAAGIPVFTADIACLDPQARVVCHIATDNLGGGRQAAEAMIEALGNRGGEVVIIDYKEVESCILRVQGFKEVIDQHNAEHPDRAITIVAELPGGGEKDQGYKAAQDALESHPRIVGIFAINDPSALGAYAALDKAGKTDSITLIGFDGQPQGRKAILDGKIYADPVQFTDRIGRMSVQAIIDYFDGEDVPSERLIPTELYRQADAHNDPSLR